MEPAQLAIADKPYKAMCVADEDGYAIVSRRKPAPIGTSISELPIRKEGVHQKCRRNKLFALTESEGNVPSEDSR